MLRAAVIAVNSPYPKSHCNCRQCPIVLRASCCFHICSMLAGVCTTKTWEIPFIPAKSVACMSMPWSLGYVSGRPSHARAERKLLTR